MNKKMFISAVVVILVFLLAVLVLFAYVLMSRSKEKEKVSEKSKEVVYTWGTYDYNTFPDTYLQNLKPLVTPSYYKSLGEDKESLGKREFNIKKNQYSFRATPQEIVDIKKDDDNYIIIVKTRMNVSSKSINKEEVKNISVSIEKIDGKYLASYIIAK